ncbi:MATE family efflux transporter [Clostridium estertheticum]|uniref:MATE family efflux transporter n=1 Tax=Clostridium estertheticum TaxID=238834 RepID=UPI001CF2B035|nr:MATE family efflux transporter [Clostridium estertheticum]MCB2308181.1 MATE family efflux transporter [Clostridium estertheticum]MCB2346240.1 MATE family efflux transporter [Clostridium estertheticum]MCB2349568.1 MATE family efflux transporter [Clostridium estertheticum]WAG46538.1 MATE family efflux transporter [Clostridium estertheticum]
MDNSNELATEKVGSLLWKFSIPAIIGMLVNALYSVVDRIFIGRGVPDPLALSGVAITFPITNVIMAFGMLVGIGGAAVVSIKLGQNRKEDAEKILGNAFVLVVIMSIVVSIIGLIFLEPILVLLGASPDTMPYAKQFGFIILLGVILQNLGFGMNPFIRSEGNALMAMVTMLIGAILNFILNPIFIFGLHMGVVGSALATIISQAVCSIWVLLYFLRGKSVLKLRRKNMKLQMKIVKEILEIGMSPFAMQMAAGLITVTFNKSLKKYGGDLAIGAFSLINSINMLIMMPIFGLNQGAQPIIGYNYGAKSYKRVKLALKYAAIIATLMSVVGFVIVQLFSVQIISIFNNTDKELIDLGSRGIRIFLIMLPLIGSQVVFTNYFQAVGKAKISIFLSLLRQIIVLFPLILLMPHFFKLDGIWMAGPASDFIAFIITIIIIVSEIKSMNKHELSLERINENII